MPALMPRLAVIVASALSIACVGPFGSKAASAASCPSGEVWMPAQVSADGLGGRVRIEVSEEVGHCVAVGGLDKTEVNDPGRPGREATSTFHDRPRKGVCLCRRKAGCEWSCA